MEEFSFPSRFQWEPKLLHQKKSSGKVPFILQKSQVQDVLRGTSAAQHLGGQEFEPQTCTVCHGFIFDHFDPNSSIVPSRICEFPEEATKDSRFQVGDKKCPVCSGAISISDLNHQRRE